MTRPILAITHLVAAAGLLFTSSVALAADASLLPPVEEGMYKTLVDQVSAGQTHEYQQTLAAFDSYIAAHPTDAVAVVERCRFIDQFAAAEDLTVESASDDAEACTEGLKGGPLADSAPAHLYLLGQTYGDEAIRAGEALLPASANWTPRQQASLHERLAAAYARKDLIKAGPHAMTATRLDNKTGVRLIAAEYLIRIGAKAAAIHMIEEMPPEQWTVLTLSDAVNFLIGLDAASTAERLLQVNTGVSVDAATDVLLARSLFAAGRAEAAHRWVQAAMTPSKQQYVSLITRRELFDLELEHGTAESASAAYRNLRARGGYRADPFGHHRVALSLRFPRTPWSVADAGGLAALLALLGILILLPLVVVVPLHYRSVVKQLRGRAVLPATDGAPWSLKHVWYVLAVMQVAGVLAMYFIDYPDLHALVAERAGMPQQYGTISSDRQLGNAMLVASGISVLALLPLLLRTGWRTLLIGEWSVKRSLFTGLGCGIALVIVSRLVLVMKNVASHHAVLGTDTIRGLQGINSAYGALALFAYAALAVPIIEEVVFRGVLLRTVSRYYAFLFALVVQAGIFMVSHEDTSTFAFIFALAVIAGWLARRSGGLLAPIALHATNNAVATLSVVVMSRVFEHLYQARTP